jgi:cyclic pyranopterin phosphate synthase
MSLPRTAELTHLDREGRARMVDVSAKEITERRARAQADVVVSPGADAALRAGTLRKGAPHEVVRLAALQAAKQTATLIPLCHPLRLTKIDAALERVKPRRWRVTSEVVALDRTGVEMEALAAAAVGALTLYDMVKAVDRAARIERVMLLEKSGGKSGRFLRGRTRSRRDGA